jgi:predicted ester cyclase
MSRVLGALLLGVLVIGVMGVSQTDVSPRLAGGTLLFDNETGAEVVRLGILFDGPVTICKDDIIVFGGEAVARLDMGSRTAWIDAKVLPGGTLQVTYSGGAQVHSAYWAATAQEKNKAIIRWSFVTVWNGADPSVASDFIASNAVVHGDGFVGELLGVEGSVGFGTTTRTAMPDMVFTVEDLVAEDDMVLARMSYTGTNTGPMFGIPPTGLPMTSKSMFIARFNDGKIEEGWIQLDGLGMLLQLGLIPPMGAPDYGWGIPSPVTGDPGAVETNKILTSREPSEVWNEGNLDVIDEIIAEGFVGHYDMGNTVQGVDGFRQYVSNLLTAFPDFHVTVNMLFAENDLVVFQATASGTNLGPFGPIPATGNPWQNTAIVVRRVADGKIVELWQVGDMLSLLMQIGLVPPLQ